MASITDVRNKSTDSNPPHPYCLLAEYRANPNEMVTARITRLTSELGKLGLSPSDRAGLEVYKPGYNEYDQFDDF